MTSDKTVYFDDKDIPQYEDVTFAMGGGSTVGGAALPAPVLLTVKQQMRETIAAQETDIARPRIAKDLRVPSTEEN